MRAVSVLLGLGLLAATAHAADGVREINQACVLSGCFPNDSPGFPVNVSEPGSYRLTGNLTIPDGNTDGVLIQTAYVTLDLNGFTIEGPNTYGGPGGVCSAPGTGRGISVSASNAAISNGHVRGAGSHGIHLFGGNYHVTGIGVEQNCGEGVNAGGSAIVTDVVARRNAGRGIAGIGRVLLRNSVSDFNGGSGIGELGSVDRWLVQGSVSNGNGIHGIDLPGANGNLVMDSLATNNAQFGISVGNNGLVLRSTASGNLQRGFNQNLGNVNGSGIGFGSANSNGANVFGGAASIACNVFGGAQTCP